MDVGSFSPRPTDSDTDFLAIISPSDSNRSCTHNFNCSGLDSDCAAGVGCKEYAARGHDERSEGLEGVGAIILNVLRIGCSSRRAFH